QSVLFSAASPVLCEAVGEKMKTQVLCFLSFVLFSVCEWPSPSTKPGVCPQRKWGSGMCAEYCSDDSDCPNNEKCCHNGCGHECTAPYTVKPGRCTKPKGTPMCAEYCYHDGQCPGEQKCCQTTCGHACSEPC
uniref:WAP four-disulfide core domain 2 n=1 Tax=Astyanax mexicanus TaxID=7994 RepID=A0A3B1II23_ASTMX